MNPQKKASPAVTSAKKNAAVLKIYTREELLGFEKFFSLGDSEVIAKRVLDSILKLTFDKIRLTEVYALSDRYICNKSMRMIRHAVNMGLLTPDKEIERTPKYDCSFDFKVPVPKIDSWASNKTKLVEGYIFDDPEIQALLTSGGNNNNNNNTSIIKNERRSSRMSTGKSKSSYLNIGDKEIKELTSLLLPKKEKEKDQVEQNLKQSPNTSTVLSKPGTAKKERKAQYAIKPKEIVFESFPIPEDPNLNHEPTDELEAVQIKGYRAYFLEKELERERRQKILKEQEENFKEEEKKRSKILADMQKSALTSWDHNGKYIQIKYIDPTQLKDPPLPDLNIRDKASIIDPDKIFNLDPNGNPKIKKDMVTYREEIPQMVAPVKYYQPDPLISHDIKKGVTLTHYGIKKSGGKYVPPEGRMTNENFNEILASINPTPHFALSQKGILRKQQEDGRESKEDLNQIQINQQNADELTKFSKVFYFLRDDDIPFDTVENINIQKQNIIFNYKRENILHHNKIQVNPTKEELYKIKKKQKAEKIQSMKEFNINMIEQANDEKIYDAFYMYNSPIDTGLHRVQLKNMPVNLHGNKKKELGDLKKYPRERVAKTSTNKILPEVKKEKEDKGKSTDGKNVLRLEKKSQGKNEK